MQWPDSRWLIGPDSAIISLPFRLSSRSMARCFEPIGSTWTRHWDHCAWSAPVGQLGPVDSIRSTCCTEGKAIGCGWQPTSSKALDLNPDDYQAEHLKYVQCNRCFRKYTFPTGWGEMRPPEPIHSDDDGASTVSSGSLTDDQDDTASEAEQIPAQSLHLGAT